MTTQIIETSWPERDFEKAWARTTKKIIDEQRRRGNPSPVSPDFPEATMYEAKDVQLGVSTQSIDVMIHAERTIGLQIEFTRGRIETNLADLTIGNIVQQVREGARMSPDEAVHYQFPNDISIFRTGDMAFVQAGDGREIPIKPESAAVIAQIICDAVWPQEFAYQELAREESTGMILPAPHRSMKMRSSVLAAVQAITKGGVRTI